MPTSIAELVTVDALESRYMHHVLDVVKGNKSRAARILGFDRRTLYRKLDGEQAAESAADVPDLSESDTESDEMASMRADSGAQPRSDAAAAAAE